MNVAVVGAGKMGLPLACVFARNGADVVACDIKQDVVDAINAGRCPIDEPGVPEILAAQAAEGRLRATTDTAGAAAHSDVVVVIVPVMLTPERTADLRAIESVTRQIAKGMRRGALVSYETTLPVGGTRRLLALLEAGGLRGGQDFDLVFSPERVKSQRVIERLTENPKIVGGLTPAGAARGAEFYRRCLGAPVINVGSLETAEMVKLAGMVYRDVNIALANELALYCQAAGVDFYTVVAAANNDGESALLTPGIGVGGHCTPVYPHFLFQEAPRLGARADLSELGRAINARQPAAALDLFERKWAPLKGRRAAILGLGFRPKVKEDAYSPAFALRDELARRGAAVSLHDPLYTAGEIRARGFEPADLDASPAPEALVLNTAHPEYAKLDFARLAAAGLKAVLDGRGLWDGATVKRSGLAYVCVGRP